MLRRNATVKPFLVSLVEPVAYLKSELKISRQWRREETVSLNTERWTNVAVSNCRHVLTLILLPGDQTINVTIHGDSACHVDKWWRI